MSQSDSDEERPDQPPGTRDDEPVNPYKPPIDDERKQTDYRPPSRSGAATLLKGLGLTVAAILLLIVVGFGLLVGCCALEGM